MTSSVQPTTSYKVFVIGATGGVGGRVISRLIADGHAVTGMHRAPDGADAIRGAGARAVRGDVAADSAADLADLIAGHDAVVFCAGAGGGDQVTAIDGAGPGNAAQAAARAGVTRFVLVSVFMDAWRGDESPGEDFERYMSAKRHADVDLAATDLDWLIVRPGTLTDDDGTGRITAGMAVAYDTIPRDDVAGFIAAGVFTPGLNRVAVEITAGETPIEEALSALQPRPASRPRAATPTTTDQPGTTINSQR